MDSQPLPFRSADEIMMSKQVVLDALQNKKQKIIRAYQDDLPKIDSVIQSLEQEKIFANNN